MNADPVPATSTNSDLYAVSIKGGEAAQDHRSLPARMPARATRPMASTSPGAPRTAPATRATAGG